MADILHMQHIRLLYLIQMTEVQKIFHQGMQKALKKDYVGALKDLDMAIALEPSNFPGFYNNRGVIKSDLGDKKGALEDYNKAIELNKESAHFYFNRAETKAYLYDYKGAIEDYNKSLNLNPLDKEVVLQKHLAELYLKRTEKKETTNHQQIDVFISYSHKDEELKNELEKHLESLKRMNFIRTWNDRKITAGREWENEIDSNLVKSKIFLALISPDFISSEYCYSKELEFALDKHSKEECVVVPIILRPVIWKILPLGKIQGLPKDGKAITTWENLDEALLDVAEGILTLVEKIRTNHIKV